jgi:hypothetical protein
MLWRANVWTWAVRLAPLLTVVAAAVLTTLSGQPTDVGWPPNVP